MLMPEVSMSSMQQQHGRMLHQSTAAGPVEAIGFSGSGFL
jgi:hypothetical protein